jgi:aminocarboxymuconate-semialdehyde decarboxylase
MAPADACHRHVMIDGKNYRTVSDKCWTTTRRLADFQEMGIQLQAISPMPELLSYWLSPSDGAQLIRFLNEQIAMMVHESAGQLVGMGAVPLQDLTLAIQELHHIKHVLGLRGVEIGSNINGVVMGDPKFDPFFEACVALDMSVFVHALRPTGPLGGAGAPAASFGLPHRCWIGSSLGIDGELDGEVSQTAFGIQSRWWNSGNVVASSSASCFCISCTQRQRASLACRASP